MDFAQHVGKGFGAGWRGVIFRREYKELSDIVAKSKRLFKDIFPDAKFLEGTAQYKWVWKTGEELALRVGVTEEDYWHFHGTEIPYIAFDDLSTWPNLDFYHSMKSVCRSSHPGMPRKIRATTNPWGPAHGEIKAYFISVAAAGEPYTEPGGRTRVHLFGSIWENQYLLDEDPDYVKTLMSEPNPNKRKAWLEGSWDIVAGGVFDDVWGDYNILQPFAVPRAWRMDRSFDWGSSHPFSVLWWAIANGEDVEIGCEIRQFPAGTLICIAEWYGFNGKPNQGLRSTAAEVARGIIEHEVAMGIHGRVRPSAADSSIYAVQNGNCIADDMSRVGVTWVPANKGPGSRVNGLEIMRRMLKAGAKVPMEEPGLFFTSNCRHALRTIPVMPRDPKNINDTDSESEDHAYDAARYRVLALAPPVAVRRSLPF